MEYKAIVKRKSDGELQHWKYIKRVKGKDGKWQYFYDSTQLRKHQVGVTEHNQQFHDKGVSETNVYYAQGKHLFDKVVFKTREENLLLMESGKKYTADILYSQGTLTRGIAKGEKWIYDNLISDKKKRNVSINIQNNWKDYLEKQKQKPKTDNTPSNRPTGRKKNITGVGKQIKRRGEGLGGKPNR